MSNSTEVYCLNAYDDLGNFLCTLRCGQPSEIGQDYSYLIPNIGNREVDYICYTDKCGCACCLSKENEIIIHSTQGEIKTLTSSASKNCIGIQFSEIFGGNWCKTMVRYKTGGYPTSISDGSLGFEELTQNQYCSTTKWITGLSYETTYYLRAFALDRNNNIISNKCISEKTGTNFVTTCRGYTGTEQSIQLGAGTYKLEVWGASGGRGSNGTCGGPDGGIGGCGGYSSGCITLSNTTTLYIYVGGRGCDVVNYSEGAGGYNGGGSGICCCGSRGGGGGGATHIATASGLLCTLSGNQSAVKIVAGGGGGTTWNCNVGGGGHGGGLCGTQGGACQGTGGGGGTQTGGGAGGNNGGFGYGGNSGTGSNNSGGGGGGGWYGGGGGYSLGGGCMSNGGGGSGYIGGVSGGITCRGNEHFPTPAGGDEIGHNGCGCVKISPV